MTNKSGLMQTNLAKRELSKPVNKIVRLRSMVKTELKTELKTKSLSVKYPQYGKINQNAKSSGPVDKSTPNQTSNNIKSGDEQNVTQVEFLEMMSELKSHRAENRKLMESYIQQLELDIGPNQSCKQLGEDAKYKRRVKSPPRSDKRPSLKTQLHSQAYVTMKGKDVLLEKQVVRLRDKLKTEQEKIAELTFRNEILQEENAKLNETIQIQSGEIETFCNDAQITSKTTENLRKENAELKEIIQTLTKEIAKLSNDTHIAFEREQKLQKENAELEEMIQIQSKDVAKLSNEAEIAIETTKKLKKEVQEAIKAKDMAIKTGDTHYDEATKLMARVNRMENFITTITIENENLKMEKKSLIKKNESLSTNFDWLESIEYEKKIQRHKTNLINLEEANKNMLKLYHQEVNKFEQEKQEQKRIFNEEKKNINAIIRRKNKEIDTYKEEIKTLKYNLRYYQDYDDNAESIYTNPSIYGGIERVTTLRCLN